MKKLLFLLGLLPCFLMAQNEDRGSIWCFRDSIGIDFSQNPPRLFSPHLPVFNPQYAKDKIAYLNPLAQAASIKTVNGFLYIEPYYAWFSVWDTSFKPRGYLAYSGNAEGLNIRDQDNNIIINGDSLSCKNLQSNPYGVLFVNINDSLMYLFCYGIYRGTVMRPTAIGLDGERTIYLPDYDSLSWAYARIKYNKIVLFPDGKWRVTQKNVIADTTAVVPKLAAVKHHNGKDWWVFAHERNASNGFLRFLVSEKGVEQHPTQYIGRVHVPAYYNGRPGHSELGTPNLNEQILGQMTVSQDGTKLACVAEVYVLDSLVGGRRDVPILDVFDIDRCTGKLYNHQDWGKRIPPKVLEFYNDIFGCQFSKSSRYIYFNFINGSTFSGVNDVIFRFDSFNKKAELIRTDTTQGKLTNSVYPLQIKLGYDNKLYIASDWYNPVFPKRKYIPYVAFPDSSIEKVGYKKDGLFLEGRNQEWGLPNNPNYDLGPVPPLPLQKQPVAYRDTLCPQDTARLGGYFPGGRFVHRWSPMTGLSYVEGDSGTVLFHPTTIPQQDTLYTFVMTTSGRPNTCHDGEMSSDTFRILVHGRNHRPCFVSVPEPEAPSSPKILVYPNPTNGTLYLKSDRVKMLRFMLYNTNGQIAFEQNLSSTEATLHVGNLADGTYLCKIITTEGIFTQKLMIVK